MSRDLHLEEIKEVSYWGTPLKLYKILNDIGKTMEPAGWKIPTDGENLSNEVEGNR